MTSSSEVHENTEGNEEYFASRSRDGERAEPTFDSAFYTPKTGQEPFDAATTSSEPQKRNTLSIDSILNTRGQDSCSVPE